MNHMHFIGEKPGKKKSLARGDARRGIDNILTDVRNFKEFISQVDKEIKQSEVDRRVFSKLVNIKRGLS